MSTVNVRCHLIVGASFRGDGDRAYHTGKAKVRVSINKPTLAPNEVAIALNLEIPVALFQRPALKVDLNIPAERAPFVITPIIRTNIAEAIRAATGMDISISVEEPQTENQTTKTK